MALLFFSTRLDARRTRRSAAAVLQTVGTLQVPRRPHSIFHAAPDNTRAAFSRRSSSVEPSRAAGFHHPAALSSVDHTERWSPVRLPLSLLVSLAETDSNPFFSLASNPPTRAQGLRSERLLRTRLRRSRVERTLPGAHFSLTLDVRPLTLFRRRRVADFDEAGVLLEGAGGYHECVGP